MSHPNAAESYGLHDRNDPTVYRPHPSPRTSSFEATFAEHYSALRRLSETHPTPGLALCLVGPCSAGRASAWLPARPDTITTATVGRHSHADLVLWEDRSLSLRQLMVIVEPAAGRWTDLRFRLIDLRTPSAITDERGRRLEALQSEGACFVRCGASMLFCLPTGEGPWPDRAGDGWDCIPERIYFDDHSVDGRPPRPDPGPYTRRANTVVTHAGPIPMDPRLLSRDETPIARLTMETRDRQRVLLVGPDALRRGILLGRYPRCDVSQPYIALSDGCLSDSSLSRVHALILEVNDKIYAMDTGSTYGTQHGERTVRQLQLKAGTEFKLADGAATVRWGRP